MSLRSKIESLFEPGKKITVQEIYAKFPKEKKTTIRGRLYDCLGKSVKRIEKGLYVSATTIVEFGDALKKIDRIVEEGDKFDFILLDIPYKAPGQRSSYGPNCKKDFFKLDTISPAQFSEFLEKCKKTLRTEDSYMCFMFTSGKTSYKQFLKYSGAFNINGLKLATQGSYHKLWGNGRPMHMGKFKMPYEHILIYNQSGQCNIKDLDLEFTLVADFSYQTAKPRTLIEPLIKTFTKRRDWVFDPFVGSGVTVKCCQALDRFCHVIDISYKSIYGRVLPILQTT